ncbi:hypothetical protein COCMIDRAFT_38634 [Bipolaris oryzae ATCC 44560]|uniref:Uncharacterized protein n=1 Tax=Bipolaris oryzae ATCC 44560 TaxID=930090 RepID=W6YVI5_COCMI|nr:uncharacterized protein COCMIDRAFT_38634 [Bipolaris oryzae ATCC 44560]EUC43437.1 hypothetical protein COCMIDRAFT_38634 [Bipolaris oryzae ATCC 44560]
MGNVVSTFNHIDRTGPEYFRLFPPVLQTQNRHLLKGGPLAIYNAPFLIAFQGLFLQLVFWGIYAGLVGFSMKRMMDLHYLCLTFTVTFLLLSIHFLSDLELNSSKLIFFTQHVGIEYLIAVRVLLPSSFVRRWIGYIFFVVWLLMVGATCVIVSNHAVYFAIAMASLSDTLISVCGLVLIGRKLKQKKATQLTGHKLTVEAISGLGFLIHGLSALPNTVAVVLILKTQDPSYYFGMVWTAIAMAGLFSAGLQVPVAAMYFENISCCCRRRRQTLPGDVGWEESEHHKEMVTLERGKTDLGRGNDSETSEQSQMPRNHVYAAFHLPLGIVSSYPQR